VLIDASRVLVSDAVRRWLDLCPLSWERVLAGGDDYELAFSCAPEDFGALATQLDAVGTPAVENGRAKLGEGRVFRVESGHLIQVEGPCGHTHGAHPAGGTPT
ncbi:MAG: hypothetical protein JXQ84_10205, partial [Rhodospirillaceae bacterium]|nr:hypothetical protein [Rhodospirillaceae bacterium]